jgi:hypothetical protein
MLTNSICYRWYAPSTAWREAPDIVKRNLSKIINTALKSKAASTTKTYINNINQFFLWCKANEIPLILPFHDSVVAMYIHIKSQKVNSASSVCFTSAALKWLHGLYPGSTRNPMDNDFCKNIVAAAKRQASRPIQKKKPLPPDAVKDIIDKFGGRQNNLKELRIAALCSLGFVDSFDTTSCEASKRTILNSSRITSKYWYPRVRQIYIKKGNLYT